MVFNQADHQILEQLFNYSISDMKPIIGVARDEKFRSGLNDKNGDDLALGLVIGNIHTSFYAGFKQRNGRTLDSQEIEELFSITFSKIPQLKEAIFQCG